MYTKYHPNISVGIRAIESKSFQKFKVASSGLFVSMDRWTDARLIAISPEPCRSGDKKVETQSKEWTKYSAYLFELVDTL